MQKTDAPEPRSSHSTLSARNKRGMAEIINLRLARKQKARLDKERLAQQNRAAHGRTKAEREAATVETARLREHVEAHRREPDSNK